MPLVSICIPTYNRAGIIRRAIDSAICQTYQNTEIIVVDNASTDDTAKAVKSISDPRIRFVQQRENTGIFGNFNRCIAEAKGDFIHILHSDDYIDPTFTETCVKFFEEHPDVSLTFTSARYISGDDKSQSYSCLKDLIFKAPAGFRKILTQQISIICPSVMVRKSVYAEIGKFSLEYPYAADYYQWLKISQKYTIGFVHDAWINYSIGNHSETFTYLFRNPLGYIDVIKIYIRILMDLGETGDDFREELNTEFYQCIKNSLSAGFLRSDSMAVVDASFFSGIAACTLSLVKSNSVFGKIKKAGYFCSIQFLALFIQFSVFRKIARHILVSHKKNGY
jgi:glycosyltransferase involved in cell wall biosynthesis